MTKPACTGLERESRAPGTRRDATRQLMSDVFKQADEAIKTPVRGRQPDRLRHEEARLLRRRQEERFLGLLLSQANHYLAIADDPPDANFDAGDDASRRFDRALRPQRLGVRQRARDALQPLAGEAAINAALLHAVERYQGAQAAGDGNVGARPCA